MTSKSDQETGKSDSQLQWQAYLVLTLTALCWGGNAVFGKLVVGEVSPMLVVSLRWLGVVLLLAVFAKQYVARDWAILRYHLVYISIMGGVGFTGFNALFYIAAHSTSAVNIGIIQGSIPVYILIGGFIIYRTRVNWLQVCGVLTTIAGVLWVASKGNPQEFNVLTMNKGDALLVMACAIYASYTVGLRSRPQVSALGFFTVMAAAAFVTSLPLAVGELYLGQGQWPTPTGWWIVLAITLFPSFAAQILFMRGVELIGPNRAGVFVNLVPVFASLMAVSFLKEPFEAYHALSLGLVLGGIWLSERGKKGAG